MPMVIYDPLYGRFTLPQYLTDLLLLPEVRRLSEVCLVNTPSPSLPALGEIKRYSHTAGVLFLCRHCRFPGFSEHDWRALEATVLLHDIGTPPFAHLLEYHFEEHHSSPLNHEKLISPILLGLHAPENRAHQIYAAHTIKFRRGLTHHQISIDHVRQIVEKSHPLSALLFGTIDLDNLDNVARMAWALGISGGPQAALTIATHLRVTRDKTLVLSEEAARGAVATWLALRQRIYDILTFDPTAIAAQALLSEALGRLITSGDLMPSDWSLTDSQLISRLQASPLTKDLIKNEFFGRQPRCAFVIHIAGSLRDYQLRNRAEAKQVLEDSLQLHFPDRRPLGYTIVDHGMFQRSLSFLDPTTKTSWEIGETSQSFVLWGFLRSPRAPDIKECIRAVEGLVARLQVPREAILRCHVAPQQVLDDDQKPLALQAYHS